MKNGRRLDILIGIFLLLLPLLWFAPQALGHKTLLPADNLFSFAPWSSYSAQMGVTVPQNHLLSDLILENYPWKSFLKEAISSRQLPLWNSRLLAGVPFLADGQHSGLYPLSIIFYLLPLWRAYGVFTWLQLGVAACGMYLFCRVLRLRRPSATLAAVAFTFSGFYIVSVNFTMMIAAAAWLPYILAVIELMVCGAEGELGLRPGGGPRPLRQSEPGVIDAPGSTSEPAWASVPASSWAPLLAVAGALLVGIQCLAGHVEITYYVLIVSAFYAAWRLVVLARASLRARQGSQTAGGSLSAASAHGLARRHGRAGRGVGRGAAWTDVRAGNWEFPPGLDDSGAGSELGMARTPTHHVPLAGRIRQPFAARLFRYLDPRLGARHGQRPWPAAEGYHSRINRLGHEELRRGGQLPGPHNAAAGRAGRIGNHRTWQRSSPGPLCR